MSGRVRLLAAAFVVGILTALGVACGGTSGSRATMATPAVMEEGRDFDPGNGEPDDGQPMMDTTVTAEPATYEPEPAPYEPVLPEPEPMAPPPPPPQLTSAQIEDIKALLIQTSIDEYDGSCPCPYHEARDGSSCGSRSAYSRGGGEEPLCYPEDVSDEMVYGYWSSQGPSG